MARQRLTDEARDELERWLPYLSKVATRVATRTGLGWEDALSATYEAAVYVAGTWDEAKGRLSTILFKYTEIMAVSEYYRNRVRWTPAKSLQCVGEPRRIDPQLAAVDAADEVDHIRQSVPPREWELLVERHGYGQTYREMGRQHGRSVERIRQLCERGLRMAREGKRDD